MNKRQYLGELNSYLTYMTQEDRTAVVSRYSAMFDQADSPEAERELIERIGTPLTVTLQMNKDYKPGMYSQPEGADPSAELEPAGGTPGEIPPVAIQSPQTEPEPMEEAELPDQNDAIAPEPDVETRGLSEPEPDGQALSSEEEQAPETSAEGHRESANEPLGAGATIKAVVLSVLSLIASIVMLIPATAALAIAVAVAMGVAHTLEYVPDTLLVLGAAIALFFVAILLILLAVRVIAGLFRLCAGSFNPNRVEKRDKFGQKLIRTVLWLDFVLLLIAAALIVVAFITGGSIEDLRNHGQVYEYFSTLAEAVNAWLR